MWRTGTDSPRPGAMTGHSVSSAPSEPSEPSEQAPGRVTLRAIRDALARIADERAQEPRQGPVLTGGRSAAFRIA